MFYLTFGRTRAGYDLTRGEALRALIAAVIDTSYVKPSFTTNEVFQNVRSPYAQADEIRSLTSGSKLVSVALRRAKRLGHCRPSSVITRSKDHTSHDRPKRVWTSTHFVPTHDFNLV